MNATLNEINNSIGGSVEEIFEIAKEIYNVPNSPLTHAGIDAIAGNLDNIVNNIIARDNEYLNDLTILKDLAIRECLDNNLSSKVIQYINELMEAYAIK